ncbi:right-handed parallel beta-helix repeat-containing protein [Pseudothermotoga thermarum]|uniref:Pectate disaccharide-lyase n=1 Tax=Pseudothermotoga thermarum DSM 5069 TaxID=688269 RepID=F7YUH5_9THEM|nr:fibronectin type III domain-containing protein [Pseudothermotoga thermarum]AEH51446.1 Pectate disaccharide-lyase [Pseudothermotoga thermarum DSM 5069]
MKQSFLLVLFILAASLLLASVKELVISELESQTLNSSIHFGEFLITATFDKTVVIEPHSKIASDGTAFTKRLKLGGAGTAEYRSIHFKVDGPATVIVYLISSSSSEDRKLDLYKVDGTLVASVPALGQTLEKQVFEITEAGTYYLASPKGGVNIYYIRVEEKILPKELVISELESQKITSPVRFGPFLITATADKPVDIEPHSKVASDGTTFTKRLKLNGAGTAEYRSIHFSVNRAATVIVYLISSSSSEDRQLNLYKLDGTLVGSVPALGKSIEKQIFKITEPGDYYLASPRAGVNIYYIRIEEEGSEAVQKPRPAWDQVPTPKIVSVKVDENDPNVIIITFEVVTGFEGADLATIEILDEQLNKLDEILVGSSKERIRQVSYSPKRSGTYHFKVVARRTDEELSKDSEIQKFSFLLPLSAPKVEAYTRKNNSLLVEWSEVKEAEKYIVEFKRADEDSFKLVADNLTTTFCTITDLIPNVEYDIKVTAVRGEQAVSGYLRKKVAETEERKWKFIRFGQTTYDDTNRIEFLEDGSIRLHACIYDPNTLQIVKKGGKFTDFFDGISFYYTEVNPYEENFVLTATFHVDYINPTPDGQEGFGIIIRDSLGVHGSTDLFMTNSAGIICGRMRRVLPDGTTQVIRPAMGTRFVYGLTPEHIEKNITTGATVVYNAFDWTPGKVVKQGDTYTLTLKKTNTGYHAILNNDPSTEIIMYDNGWKKLTVLDPEKIYVGFAAARGTVVTITNISFTTSDPKTDPPAEPEPLQAVEPVYRVLSPSTSGLENYKFVFFANADGKLSIFDEFGTKIVDGLKVTANIETDYQIKLKEGINKFKILFTPEPNYRTKSGESLSSYETKSMEFQVEYRYFANEVLYVSPTGSPDGKGTLESPIDIHTAVNFARPGQTIVLEPGVYKMRQPLVIHRGIDGEPDKPIVMKVAGDQRAILDFKGAGAGPLSSAFAILANHWHIKNLDVCNSDGNVKGINIAGHHNILERVNAYNNGDTGIQISGFSADPFEKWPTYNLILSCMSYNNCDPGANNADGFAAKITVGPGNVFRNCIAFNNVDDGWDLYSKVETGPIGVVVIENCVAYNNGITFEGRTGEGNGFKLGGEGIPVKHVLANSIAYNNLGSGITSNSNPATIVMNTTSAFNKKSNYALYGRSNVERTFEVKGIISFKPGAADIVELASLLEDPTNYFNGRNINGEIVSEDWFESVDITITPTIDEHGYIDMKGLFVLTNKAPCGVGAVLPSFSIGCITCPTM